MIRVNIHDAKTHLSKYLRKVAKGETIILCRRNVPIAEIVPVPPPPGRPRPVGLGKGSIVLTPQFFEPLPDDLLDLFEGKGEKNE